MQGAVIEADTFSKLCIIDSLRTILGDGFQSALRLFPITGEMLEVEHVDTDFNDGSNQVVQTKKGSSTDRVRANCRKQDRRMKEASFFEEGDDCWGDDA